MSDATDLITIEVPGPLLRVLRNLEVAAREVDVHFGSRRRRLRPPVRVVTENGSGIVDLDILPEPTWTFDGKAVGREASQALLSLHDYLNELRAVGGDDW